MHLTAPTRARRATPGLTVLELIAVIVIIGILAGVAISSYTTRKEGQFLDAMRRDLQDLAAVQQAYFVAHHAFAGDKRELGFRERPDVTVTIDAHGDSSWAASARHRGTPTVCTVRGGAAKLPEGAPPTPTCATPVGGEGGP